MAGTINLSMTQQMDQYGDPLSGGLLYFMVAGTVSTPQNAFQDLGLTLVWPNPIVLDASGRIPQFFLADGLIKIRLTDQHGVTILVADNVQVIGPSSGGSGSGATIDPTTIYQTGDLKVRYSTGSHTGWVRCNGKTIGNTGSPANEHANPDAQALFQFLWNNDVNLVVSGGRGSSSLVDWNGGKTIALPDWRGCTIAGMDDMGATSAGRLTTAYFGQAATTLGAAGGWESVTLTTNTMPAHSHTANSSDAGHAHFYSTEIFVGNQPGGTGAGHVTGTSTGTTAVGNASITTSIDNAGGSLAHNNTQPTKVATIYIKL
jgi:microcystin-dependent protein